MALSFLTGFFWNGCLAWRQVHPEWSPYGAARFLHLVKNGFYTDIALFRVNAWIVQFGAVGGAQPHPIAAGLTLTQGTSHPAYT